MPWQELREDEKFGLIIGEIHELHLGTEAFAYAVLAREVDLARLPAETRREFEKGRAEAWPTSEREMDAFDRVVANVPRQWHEDGHGDSVETWEDQSDLEKVGYALESATWERAQQRREGSAAEGTARPSEHGEYQVWHITNYARALLNWFRDAGDSVFPEAYTRVATVEADSLDQVFALTNHGEKPWQENPGVVGTDARSTSVGDVIVDLRGRPYRVENTGFRELPSRNESPVGRIERNLREMKQQPEIPLESTWHYVEPIPGDVNSIYDTCDTLGPWHTLNSSERLLALHELSWEGVSPEDKQRIINRETVDFPHVSTAGQPPSSFGELAGGPAKEEPGKGTYQVWHDTSWPNSRIAHLIAGPEPRFPDDYAHVANVQAASLNQAMSLTEHGNILSGGGRNWTKNPEVQALVDIPRSTAVGDVIVDPQAKAHRFDGNGFSEIRHEEREANSVPVSRRAATPGEITRDNGPTVAEREYSQATERGR